MYKTITSYIQLKIGGDSFMIQSKYNIISTIKTKFIMIYILNFTDIIFTFLLLNTGVFYEANPLMHSVIENPMKSLILKGVAPGLLLLLIYIRMRKASEKQLVQGNLVINLCLIFYILINICHLFFITLVFFSGIPLY